MLDKFECANCGRGIDGESQAFCPACGQPTPAHRIDWHFLGHELEHSILHMDRGALYTLKNLMLRPGHLIRDYLEGRRQGVVKPLLLVMMTAAAVVLLGHWLLGGDVMSSGFTDGMQEGMRDGPATADAQAKQALLQGLFEYINRWLNQHVTLLSLILLPIYAAVLKLAFRGVRQLNYPEWLVIMAFLTAQACVIWCISIPFQRLSRDIQPVMLVMVTAYNVFSLVQLFQPYPRWKSLLRSLLGYAAVNVLVVVLTFMVTVVLGYLVTSGKLQLPSMDAAGHR